MIMNENNKVPKYQLIENDIIDKINSGIYQEEHALPTEAELSKQYECSRVTVRQALSNLAYKGFILKNQGSGSFVKKSRAIQRTPLLKSFTEDILEMGKTPSSKVVSFNITEAGNTVASLLKIKPKDLIYYIERTRYADNEPVLFEKTFMSVDLHPELSIKVLQGSKYKYADEHNLTVDYAHQNITPIFPPEYIAAQLKLSPKQPILRVCNTTYIHDGTVFDYTELYMHPELYQLNIIKKR
ncbi:MAG: GntR family transcriptional regulator [Erysipelotrichaceae bacterium]|nr:GntR family transcriptional regulator [Erysipelotrichaceae bacterium]